MLTRDQAVTVPIAGDNDKNNDEIQHQIQRTSTPLGGMKGRRTTFFLVGLLMIIGAGFFESLASRFYSVEQPVDYGNAVLDLATTSSIQARGGETEEHQFQSNFTLTYPREMTENQTSVVTLSVDAYLLTSRATPTSPGANTVERIDDVELDGNSGIALISSGFEIAPENVITKRAGTTFPTEYNWTITPKREGEHKLLLDFSDYIGSLDEDTRLQSSLSINNSPALMKRPDTAQLDVMVQTKWGASATVVVLIQAVAVLIGFGLVYPSAAKLLRPVFSGKISNTEEQRASTVSIFISYRRADDPYAARGINDLLCSKFGKQQVYFDLAAMEAGLDYRAQIEREVENCDVMLVIIGEDWFQSDMSGTSRLENEGDWVRVEIAMALSRNIPVIPVLVGRAEMPSEDSLPEQLKPLVYRQAREVRPTADFDSQIKTLIDDIESIERSLVVITA